MKLSCTELNMELARRHFLGLKGWRASDNWLGQENLKFTPYWSGRRLMVRSISPSFSLYQHTIHYSSLLHWKQIAFGHFHLKYLDNQTMNYLNVCQSDIVLTGGKI
ncbi:hypothetical protein ILYODFUR_034898 [Ilyodon furcidens]|uniref:Uncharacterized protein n=1 Tax=Ilyodon furcidens TaxID=33524 RepID=A0ABV0UYY4_9TELE